MYFFDKWKEGRLKDFYLGPSSSTSEHSRMFDSQREITPLFWINMETGKQRSKYSSNHWARYTVQWKEPNLMMKRDSKVTEMHETY